MRERMLRGELYIAEDPELALEFTRAQELLARYNATAPGAEAERAALLRRLLGSVGDGVVIRPPFRCEYGSRVSVGPGTFFNFDCLMLDVAPVTIGADCQVAPRVQFLTATHPVDPAARRARWESAASIVVADNVWLGGGAILCPGVTVGRDTVVGAGAVVTRSLPAGVVAHGVPARVVREIGEADRVDPPDPGRL